MSSKKIFKIEDKVFAKIRGHPAWPALVSSIKNADTPSKTKYNVLFYGTGERGECKPEDIYPYDENKTTMGKLIKRKYFAKALEEIEYASKTSKQSYNDSQTSVTSSNNGVELETHSNVEENVSKKQEISENNLKTKEKITNYKFTFVKEKKYVAAENKLGISVSKIRKRKSPFNKFVTKRQTFPKTKQFKNQQMFLVENSNDNMIKNTTGNQIHEIEGKQCIPDGKTSKTDKNLEAIQPNANMATAETVVEKINVNWNSMNNIISALKVEDSQTSTNEKSSNISNICHVSRSDHKIKPKVFFDYENNLKMQRKRSKISQASSEVLNKQISTNTANDQPQKQIKTKDKSLSSETKMLKKEVTAPPLLVNDDPSFKDLNKNSSSETKMSKIEVTAPPTLVSDPTINDIHKKIKHEHNIFESYQKNITIESTSIEERENSIKLLYTELEMIDCISKIQLSLLIKSVNFKVALEELSHLKKIQINALMLKKHREVFYSIQKLCRYVGNIKEWDVKENELEDCLTQISKVRFKASKLLLKFMDLFCGSDNESLEKTFDIAVKDFDSKTKHLTSDQISGLTSEDQIFNF